MRINHNIASLNTYRQLSSNTGATSKSLEKLSSGLRINRAGDDAAGLAISEKMRGQIRGLDQASRNAADGISMIQTAEGALNETHSILQRMRELAVQSANDTNVDVDRSEIQKEIDELAKEVTRIANSTEFNTQKLINGGKTADNIGSVKFHVGANASQDIELSIGAMDAKTLGISRDKVSSATATASAVNISSASFKGDLGAGIVDGSTLTFDFTVETPAVIGYEAENTATNNAVATTNLSTMTGTDNSLAVTVGTTTYTLDDAALKAWTGTGTDANLATLLGTATDGTNALSTVANITVVGGKLNIASKTQEPLAVTVAVAGTSAANVTTAFGFTNGDAQDVAGQTAVAYKSATVKISGSSGHSQTVNVTAAATSLSVKSGNFEGMTLNLATNIQTDLDGAATITIDATSDVASAAIFADGALTTEATTDAGIDVSTQGTASTAISTIQNAIETVSSERSKLGAYQNRLEHTINNLGTSSENLTAAESRVRDVDMANEMMAYTKNNILTQAATAMLAQANQQPQGVLQLLQ